MQPLKVIGLNSGTSMDGVDAALFQIEPSADDTRGGEHRSRLSEHGPPRLSVTMLASVLYPFEDEFRRQLQETVASGQAQLDTVCRMNVALGEVFAASALELINTSGIALSAVGLIGSHGQTIWHAPQAADLWGQPTTGTLQLGEPAIIAARTGLPVVADFRVQDMAVGGQGAPLVAFADQVLFGRYRRPTGVLNIGGIANITLIDDGGEAAMAFDTGPGNMVIDRAVQVLFGVECDIGGALAKSGRIEENWLSEILELPYFATEPPKTTGREAFGYPFADKLIADGQQRQLSREDIIATLTALTPMSIIESYLRFVEPVCKIERLVLGGGGAENETVTELLRDFWPHNIQIRRHEDFGISTKFKEALLFALLGYTTYFGIPNNVPRCTGATRRVCMGKLCRP